MKALINWLRDAHEKHHILGHDVYYGSMPFDVDRNKQEDIDRIMKVPWVISHPDAKDKLFRCVGFDYFCIQWIRKGRLIGLKVKEIANPEFEFRKFRVIDK